MTKVVFAVDPDGKYSEMSSSAISLIRASFKSLVTRQPYLHLTSNLFGDPSSFEVLKFKGGITIIPQQSGFPLQTMQTLFNFTLNFSIYQIQSNFEELTSQLKSGLHLAPYEVSHSIFSSFLFQAYHVIVVLFTHSVLPVKFQLLCYVQVSIPKVTCMRVLLWETVFVTSQSCLALDYVVLFAERTACCKK